jgi:hypothetical protein
LHTTWPAGGSFEQHFAAPDSISWVPHRCPTGAPPVPRRCPAGSPAPLTLSGTRRGAVPDASGGSLTLPCSHERPEPMATIKSRPYRRCRGGGLSAGWGVTGGTSRRRPDLSAPVWAGRRCEVVPPLVRQTAVSVSGRADNARRPPLTPERPSVARRRRGRGLLHLLGRAGREHPGLSGRGRNPVSISRAAEGGTRGSSACNFPATATLFRQVRRELA